MKIVKMKVSDLKPAEYNPRILLEPGMPEYEKLKENLLEHGLVEPPVFNESRGNLVGGHQRINVAKAIGLIEPEDLIEVSVVNIESLSKEKALNVALNKIDGRWDDLKLKEILESLEEEYHHLTGFDETEISSLIESFTPLSDNQLGDFANGEIDLSEFSDEEFECQCPKCGFRFNREY